jgi:hypothetical protein
MSSEVTERKERIMPLDRDTLSKLRRFTTVFREARERGANESDTMMFLVRMFEEVFGYDAFKGEISKELAIKDKYCDIALKIDGAVRILVEGKSAGLTGLVAKNIQQAEEYASRAGIRWVLLTNGIEWKLFHLTWAEGEGIEHDLAFEADAIAELDADAESLWSKLCLLSRSSVAKGLLDDFWERRKALSPGSVVKALFTEEALLAIRKVLNRNAPARLDIQDVFEAVRDALAKEAIAEAGDLTMKKKRKKKRVKKSDSAIGATLETDDEVSEVQPACQPADESKA